MRVLIIEDDKAVANCLEEILELDGHDCDVFYDPLKGVSAFKIGEYDVVLTDIKMPGMNGLEVLEAVRSQVPDAFVIIMTGYADLENAIGAVNAGAFAFFRKPLEVDKLKTCLKRVERELTAGRDKKDLGDELVKLCMELKEFEQTLNPESMDSTRQIIK